MEANLESAIDFVHSLPLAEQDKLFAAMQRERQTSNNENRTIVEPTPDELRFQKSLEWARENRQEYDGQWVVLDGDKLIAHGADAKAVYAQAKAKGIETPFLKRIKAEQLPFGGW